MASPCVDNSEEACSSTNDSVLAVNIIENNDYDSMLKEYEELFVNRYTKDDKCYMESIKKRIEAPPLVHPWYNKQRRNFDYNNRGRRGGNDRWVARGRHWSDRGRGDGNYSKNHNNNRYNQY